MPAYDPYHFTAEPSECCERCGVEHAHPSSGYAYCLNSRRFADTDLSGTAAYEDGVDDYDGPRWVDACDALSNKKEAGLGVVMMPVGDHGNGNHNDGSDKGGANSKTSMQGGALVAGAGATAGGGTTRDIDDDVHDDSGGGSGKDAVPVRRAHDAGACAGAGVSAGAGVGAGTTSLALAPGPVPAPPPLQSGIIVCELPPHHQQPHQQQRTHGYEAASERENRRVTEQQQQHDAAAETAGLRARAAGDERGYGSGSEYDYEPDDDEEKDADNDGGCGEQEDGEQDGNRQGEAARLTRLAAGRTHGRGRRAVREQLSTSDVEDLYVRAPGRIAQVNRGAW
ncbi:hypothetical protein MBLNU459_g7829t1 [Dothideomycetes sp. NU459]